MKPGHLIMLIVGCLLALPGLALTVGGAGLGGAYLFERDADDYVSETLEGLGSPTAAITAGELELVAGLGSPDRLLERVDARVRIDVAHAVAGAPLFVGIGPAADVDAYLADVAHDEVVVAAGDRAQYRRSPGVRAAGVPAEQDFWVASASGEGPQRVEWTATEGRWVAVLMNADGSPGVDADATIGARAGLLLPLAAFLLALGAATSAAAALFIAFGVLGRPGSRSPGAEVSGPDAAASPNRPPGASRSPVTLTATLDPGLSRWHWLVKWVLVLPHLVVLAFLWAAFVPLTVAAGAAVLFTGRYPREIFAFNVGVLRWTWRVSYYATTGGLGTDRYPPFRLGAEPAYPATLDVAYPERLTNGLVLVKWLLALPHYVVISVLLGGSIGWVTVGGQRDQLAPLAGGLLGVLVLTAGVVLLVTGRYPRSLFDLVLGLNRWIYRVVAYVALMTDRYPPFVLDQGGTEPSAAPLPLAPAGPELVDIREPATVAR